MYDFILGDINDIEQNPLNWLLSIKRMLPRWINGLPDCEFIALYNTLSDLEKDGTYSQNKNSVIIETGCGCSTIVLLYFAIKWQTTLYSWDISSNKMAYLRGVLNDTLFRIYTSENLFNRWKYVAFDSTSKYAGISILKELNKSVILGFYDSEHTLKTLSSEVSLTIPLLVSGAAICIDDGNYTESKYNEPYTNMIRKKVGLPPVNIEDNKSNTFYEETEKLLSSSFTKIVDLNGNGYIEGSRNDLSIAYYSLERENTIKTGMLKEDNDKRFGAWRVYKQ